MQYEYNAGRESEVAACGREQNHDPVLRIDRPTVVRGMSRITEIPPAMYVSCEHTDRELRFSAGQLLLEAIAGGVPKSW